MTDKNQRSQNKIDNGRNSANNNGSTNLSTGGVANNINHNNNANSNNNNGKFPVMMPSTTHGSSSTAINQNSSRNMPSSAIIPNISIDPTTIVTTGNGPMRMSSLNPTNHHHHHHYHQSAASNSNVGNALRNHPSSYLINQSSNSAVTFNRNDNPYPMDQQPKNSMNRPHYFRSNMVSNMHHQGFNNYAFYNNKRKRRERTSFTKTQLSVLLETYAVQPYPDVQQRLDIAARIGLDESRVQVWFKNRRAKERKDELVASSIRANSNNNNNNISNTSNTSNGNNNNNSNNTNNMNHRNGTSSQHHSSNSQQNTSHSSQLSNSQGIDNNTSNHIHHNHHPSTNHSVHLHQMQQSSSHGDQFMQNTSSNRYPTNIHLPNPTPFVELFGVSAFADENDVLNQYADLLPNSQQDSNVNAFSMNPSAIGISKEEADLLISTSPSLPKLQPLNQNFSDTPTKQH